MTGVVRLRFISFGPDPGRRPGQAWRKSGKPGKGER
jgi:hypothetical protein